MTQQTVGSIGIAGVDQQNARLVGKSELYHQRKRGTAVEPANLRPWNDASTELQMRFVDLDRWPQSKIQDQTGACQQQARRDPGIRPAEGHPTRKNCERKRYQPGPDALSGSSVCRDGHRHTLSLPLSVSAVNSPLLSWGSIHTTRSEWNV